MTVPSKGRDPDQKMSYKDACAKNRIILRAWRDLWHTTFAAGNRSQSVWQQKEWRIFTGISSFPLIYTLFHMEDEELQSAGEENSPPTAGN